MVRLNPSSFRVLNQEAGSDTMHSVEGADHVGAYLREARETTGRSVGDVAQALRIRRTYLEAIEDGRFDELPGAAYAVGFVRTYAKFLRLDVPTVVERFKEEASGIQSPQHLDFPTPVPEGRFPGGIVVTLSLVVAAGIFGGWYWYQNRNAIEVAQVPPPPAMAAPARSTPAAGGSAPSAAVTAAEVASAPARAEDTANAVAEPETPDSDVPLVPPSYLRPQVDPLASMAEGSAAAEGQARETVTAAAPSAVESMAPPDEEVRAAPAAPVEVDAQASATAESPPVAAPPANAVQAVEAQVAEAPAASPDPAASDASVAPAEPAVASPPPDPAPVAAEPSVPAPTAQVASVPVAAPSTVVTPDTDGEGRIFGVAGGNARIVVGAHENTWVQVRDADENVVLTQMLRAGDRYFVPDRPDLRLMTGNAGGLDITVDGEPVPAIGARGEARRDVRLEADLLKSGQAVAR
jgi:cytoskeleton protein RodZ